MDDYQIWFAALSVIFFGAIALALLDAVRMRRWRWVVTIVIFPLLGAMAWWTAGRRAYRAESTSVRG